MPRANPWNNNLARAELDQRARDSRLRLERVERLLAPRDRGWNSRLGRILSRLRVSAIGRLRPDRAGGPLSDRRSSRTLRLRQAVRRLCGWSSLRSGSRPAALPPDDATTAAARSSDTITERRISVRTGAARARFRRSGPRRPRQPARRSCRISSSRGCAPAGARRTRAAPRVWVRLPRSPRGAPAPAPG